MKTFKNKVSFNVLRIKNKQIVINVPNVRKPVPLFILMRALSKTLWSKLSIFFINHIKSTLLVIDSPFA